MKLISINVGMPKEVEWQGTKTVTGIFKEPLSAEKSVYVSFLNIEGDGQADLSVHGGRDKAVYAYSMDSFGWWEKTIGRPIVAGEMGENLTFSKLVEAEAYVGNIYQLGTCELEVCQPRFPCFKLGIRFNDMSVVKTFSQSKRPGVYFRVHKEGVIAVGNELNLIREDPEKVSILELLSIKQPHPDQSLLRRVLRIKGLCEDWRASAQKKIQ